MLFMKVVVIFSVASGDLSKTCVYSRGSSNAAALTKRGCLEILASIEDIFVENNLNTKFDNFASLINRAVTIISPTSEIAHIQLKKAPQIRG